MFKKTKHPWTNDQILELIKLENEGNLDASLHLAIAREERMTAMSKEEKSFLSKRLSPSKGIQSTEESVHDDVNFLKTDAFKKAFKDAFKGEGTDQAILDAAFFKASEVLCHGPTASMPDVKSPKNKAQA